MTKRGIKAFNRCDVKVVEFTDKAFIKDTNVRRGDFIVPVEGFGSSPTNDANDGEDNGANQYAGSAAMLHCPRTEDERVHMKTHANFNGRLRALDDLRQQAGELLCAHCRFSSMTPVEVSIERTKFAAAEAERIAAFGLRAAAVQELEERGLRFEPGELGE